MQESEQYPKLSPFVVKRFEPGLGKYFFYNAQKKIFWQCDSPTGAVVSCLDGTLSVNEIINIISNNNPGIEKNEIFEKITETLKFLLKEGFVYES